MDYISLKRQRDGMVSGEVELSGRKFSGIFPDMELATQWATDLEECVRSGKIDETGQETDR